ncbi:reverse transcriptase domain-containing protein, partial [Acinetobacter baumannii]|uniref:reverse transcriptase domain-containing protein n=1 Tax=Acinetobacter baumannii TaxID=470 RepID=UPI003395BCB0
IQGALMFADDSTIIAKDDAEATDILLDVACTALPYGLKINTEKTKVLTTDRSPAVVYLEGTQSEQVREFKYLGSVVQQQKVTATSEVHTRIGQATAAFSSLR